jgi:hypothetical protein
MTKKRNILFDNGVPQILETLETIESVQAVYIYADPKLAQKDQRKGRR